MTKNIGSRQDQILHLLLDNKSGMDIDNLAEHLSITRNAVKQHLIALENERLIKKDSLKSTRGRPAQNYVLTEQGINYFPKQYAWFCNILLAELKADMPNDAFVQFMRRMGRKLAEKFMPKFNNKSTEERLEILLDILQQLGYQASVDNDSLIPSIKASNCVYHDLAQQYPELCEFDQALISALLDKPIEQTACMAQQDCICKFRIQKSETEHGV
ncbi:MAG: helix-turn-helix transcriptional regulator [Gammaproteobacteria bacterium]